MSQTLTVPDDVYERLTLGAAERGMTVESLFKFVTDVVVPRIPPNQQDRRRGQRIERLFAKYREAGLTDDEREELERLIDSEYQVAVERADQRIAAKIAASKKRTAPKSMRRFR